MSATTSTALLHPPSIVHFRSSSTDFPPFEEDDCSTISSAPNSPGRVSREDSDDHDDNEEDPPPGLPTNPLSSPLGGSLQLSLTYPSQLQRKNSELGRQSRKSRLRRASLKMIRQKKLDLCYDESQVETLLEEKKSAEDESPSSSVDLVTRNHKKRHCTEEQRLERPEDRNHTTRTILDDSNCSTILQNEDIEEPEDEEGDDLPLLPRHTKSHVMQQEEREYSTSSSTTATRDPSSSSTARWMVESPPPNKNDSSPMDEVDELAFPTASLDRSQLQVEQQAMNSFEEEPPSLQISSLLPLTDAASLQLHNSRPALVWKESESFDDDLDLVMSPTDEVLNQYPTAQDAPVHRHDIFREADQHGHRTRLFNEDTSNDEVPLDEQFYNMSMGQSYDDYDDIPPIARIQRNSSQQSPSSRSDPPGSSATNAIAVEDLVDWTHHAVNDDTNPLNVSHDSSQASVVGPLIRLEQHQPLLLQSLDEISSSDETPLTGNGPVTRTHGSGNRIRNRMYGEPRLHDYWKSKQHSTNRSRQRRPRRLQAANGNHNNSSARSHSSKKMDESSLDRILPPLIIDPEQLRSIGINAIMAVCNGIGNLLLSSGESSESPKDKKTSVSEPYKLLSKEEKQTKKRSRGNKYKEMSRLALDDLSQTEASLSAPSLQHPTDNDLLLNATPLYFEAALQQSIEAELRAGDSLFATRYNTQTSAFSKSVSTNSHENVAKSFGLKQGNSSFDPQFADFTNDLNNMDISKPPYRLNRTKSVPVTSNSYSREVVDHLWMEKVRAIKKCSNNSEPSPAPEDERRASVRSNEPRSTPVPEDESRSLLLKIEQELVRKPNVKSNIMERIVAMRGTKESTTPVSANYVSTNVSDNNLCSPSPALVSNTEGNPMLSPETPVIDQRRCSDMSPVDHTPLAGPPQLRRLNVSLDFQDSFGPDFSTQVLDLDEPPSLVRSKKMASDQPSTTNIAEKPSADRSPMSDFLLLRLQASSSDMSSTDLQNMKGVSADSSNVAYDSDCSSTEELVSSLDGLVRDLDGMANSRRIERKQTLDFHSSDPGLIKGIHLSNETATTVQVLAAKASNFNISGLPLLVELLTNDFGIPIGDIMISLLNTELVEPAFPSRVDESIWRSRAMRRQSDSSWLDSIRQRESFSFPTQRRSSVCVDVDDVRVMGGIEKLADTQRVALEYLKSDNFDDALVLYDDVCMSYEQFLEDFDPSDERRNHLKSFLATAHFNLGVVHSLRGEQDEAIDYFDHSTQLFSDSCGARHVTHVTSLVRTAMCHYALEDYSTAYAELELALSLSRNGIQSLSYYRQVAEILNNLGCLSYMGGEIERAMSFFRQSMEVLINAEGLALYSDSKYDGYSTLLALTIAKSNIAFLSLTFYRDVIDSISMFEAVVKDQQLLFRDHHATLTTTMEHLAAANLLAGHKDNALQMLRRVLQMQASGGDDQTGACQRTLHKIAVLEGKDDVVTVGEGTDVGSKVLPILETSRESSTAS